MDQQVCEKMGIDYKQGSDRFSGRTDLYEKFLKRFPQDPNFAALRQAMETKDCDAAFRAAHALKGVAGNLSLNGFYEQVVPLVELLRGGNPDWAGAEAMWPGIQQRYDELVTFLQNA